MMPNAMRDQARISGPRPGAGTDEEAKIRDSVREICAALVRAVTASKIFPAHHESVGLLRQAVFARLRGFFDRYGDFELEIKQSAFLFGDEVVYREDNPMRSLPYFFYKDGMQKIAFLRGLTDEEFADFLDVVRTVSLLPMDVGDIVDALWQKDFSHIRCLSPDEFIEAKLSGDAAAPHVFAVSPERLYDGRIELTPEDAADVFRKSLDLARKKSPGTGDREDLVEPLSESDVQLLEAMIESDRRDSPENRLPDLMFELLHLEDRPEAFAQILSFLDHEHRDWVGKGAFTQVVRLLTAIVELRDVLASASPDRAAKVEEFLRGIRSEPGLETLKNVALEGRVGNFKSFFAYLQFLGPIVIPLGAELYERVRLGQFQAEAGAFLEDMADRDFAGLISQGREDRPGFNRFAVELCGRKLDPAGVPFLVDVAGWKDTEGKLTAIRVLGQFPDRRARSRLMDFLEDPDESLRLAALKAVRVGDDPEIARRLGAIAGAKGFRAKSKEERAAVLNALAKTRGDEACAVLRRLLRRRGLFGRSKTLELRLAAVQALERMATLSAVEALRGGRRLRPRRLRVEIRAALSRLSPDPGSKARRP
jgi:hypothetical protein